NSSLPTPWRECTCRSPPHCPNLLPALLLSKSWDRMEKILSAQKCLRQLPKEMSGRYAVFLFSFPGNSFRGCLFLFSGAGNPAPKTCSFLLHTGTNLPH